MSGKTEETKPEVACKKRKMADGEGDMFYTQRSVVQNCVRNILEVCAARDVQVGTVVDFSAGDGYFASLFPDAETRSFDLQPRGEDVEQRNWFDVEPWHADVVGFNPPFGYQANVVRRFLVHAAKFAPEVIAVVHPFTRKSIFPDGYFVNSSRPLESDVFYNPDTERVVTVPNCRFTILLRARAGEGGEREKEKEQAVEGFTPVSRDRPWNEYFKHGIAVRRTGVNAGRQVVVLTPATCTIIDHKGEMRPWSLDQASHKAFHTFVTGREGLMGFATRLWWVLKGRLETREQGIVPTVNRAFVTACMNEVS